jgi:hypothetical protein
VVVLDERSLDLGTAKAKDLGLAECVVSPPRQARTVRHATKPAVCRGRS